MITLNLKRENYWLDILPNLRFFLRPASTAVIMAARTAALKDNPEDPIQRGTALLKALAEVAIIEWEGVGDHDGNPLPPAPDNVKALLDLWPVADAFERLYLTPALLMEQEKNV